MIIMKLKPFSQNKNLNLKKTKRSRKIHPYRKSINKQSKSLKEKNIKNFLLMKEIVILM